MKLNLCSRRPYPNIKSKQAPSKVSSSSSSTITLLNSTFPIQYSNSSKLIMHLGKTLALALLSASSGAFAFKVRAFTGENCSGDAKEINVWDNTCRDENVPATKSYRVLAYGAGRQRAAFYEGDKCIGGGRWNDWWADGGSDTFKKDACIDLGFTSNAFGSRSV